MKKQDGRKLNPEAQEALRIRIAVFLESGKGTQKEAADIFLVSLRAVKKIWSRYKQGGLKALQAKKRGPRHSTSSLGGEQVKKLKHCIQKSTPDRYHLPYFLWTADAVRLLIKKKPV